MPFPIELKFIKESEEKLNVNFPRIFKEKMMKENGGELEGDDYFFMLNPFFDKSNKKRISRTCNDIIQETKSAKGFGDSFPSNGIAIGSDNSGNQLILLPKTLNNLGEKIYFWNHETAETVKVADNINEL